MAFEFLNEQSLTAAGVTTQYIDALRNVTIPVWLQELTYFDDMSLSSVQGYPVPEGELSDMQEVPIGAEVEFSDVSIKNITVPAKYYATGFRCPRAWLLNPELANNIVAQASKSLEAVRNFWVKRALAILNNGDTSIRSERDGKLFFANDHVIGDVTGVDNTSTISLATLNASNTGTATNPSPEALSEIVTKAIVDLMLIKNGTGDEDYVNGNNNTFRVLLPLQWMQSATKAFGDVMSAQFIAGVLSKLGVNQLASDMPEMVIKYSCLPGLADNDELFVFPTDTSEKPILRRQISTEVEEFGYDSEYAKSSRMAKWIAGLTGGSAPFYFERILMATVTA